MDQAKSAIRQRVRFEEVTPAHECVAFLAGSIESLVAPLGLPVYEGYDDLDEMKLVFLTLPSGKTVTLGQYDHSPQAGVDLYVDLITPDIAAVVFESFQQLAIPRSEVSWLHPDFEEQINSLYAEHGDIEKRQESSWSAELLQSSQYEPIDCFNHALQIYKRQDFPEYWAMLQHNLGLAYADRIQDDLIENLKRSIECFNNSLEIFTQEKFPEKWKINQYDLGEIQRSLFSLEKKSLVKDILDKPIPSQNFQGADRSRANLSNSNLRGVNLSDANLFFTNLSGVDLRDANLSRANLSDSNLSGADLSYSNLVTVQPLWLLGW
jgi:Pentapeptide repeats (8 copies)